MRKICIVLFILLFNSIVYAPGFDAKNGKIINVSDPTANQDAATKVYVDTQIATPAINYWTRAAGILRPTTSTDVIDGEYLQNDSVDDDALDFTDITGGDLTLTDCGTITSSGVITGTTLKGGTLTLTSGSITDTSNLINFGASGIIFGTEALTNGSVRFKGYDTSHFADWEYTSNTFLIRGFFEVTDWAHFTGNVHFYEDMYIDGDLYITQTDPDYKIGMPSAGLDHVLEIEAQTYDNFTLALTPGSGGDKSKDIMIQIIGDGSPESANNEYCAMAYKVTGGVPKIEISSKANGTGTVRAIDIYTLNHNGQVFLKTDGMVGINNSNPTRQLDVTGNIYSSTTITADTSLVCGVYTIGPLSQITSSNGSINFDNEDLTTTGTIDADYYTSNVAIGTAPYSCTSTTLNTNLNADLWEGYHLPALEEGLYLRNTGGVLDWEAPAGGAGVPAGNNTDIQYNDGGAFGGEDNFTYTKGTDSVKLNANSTTALFVEQDGVKDNTFIIDTTNSGIGINMAPAVASGSICLKQLRDDNTGGVFLQNIAGTAGVRWYVDAAGYQRMDNGVAAAGNIVLNGANAAAGTGMVSIGNNTLRTEKLQVYETVGTGDNDRYGIACFDATAQTADVGGQFILGGKYTDAGTYTEFAIIKASKDSALTGEYGAGIKFQVRNTATIAMSTKMQLTSTGNLIIGGGIDGVDHTLTFNGNLTDGVMTWMEDEDYLRFEDTVYLNAVDEIFYEKAAPAALANTAKLYAKDAAGTTKLYYMDSAGTEVELAATAGANVALSNLAGVAINTSLISDGDGVDSLGSSDNKWLTCYLSGGLIMDGGAYIETGNQNITFGDGTVNGSYTFKCDTAANDGLFYWSAGSDYWYFTDNITTNANIYAGNGLYIGLNDTGQLIDDASNGADSHTLFIGNRTIDTTAVSDEKFKTDIKPTESVMDKIKSIPVIDFKYIKGIDDANKTFTGVTAQEMQKVFPDVIREGKRMIKQADTTDPNNIIPEVTESYLFIDYDELIPVLIKSIQELKDKNDELEKRIEALENNE